MTTGEGKFLVLNTPELFEKGSGSNWILANDRLTIAHRVLVEPKGELIEPDIDMHMPIRDVILTPCQYDATGPPAQQLFALDDGGAVWKLHHLDGWKKVTVEEDLGLFNAKAMAATRDRLFVANAGHIAAYSLRYERLCWVAEVDLGEAPLITTGPLGAVYSVGLDKKTVYVLSSEGLLIDQFEVPEVESIIDLGLSEDGSLFLLANGTVDDREIQTLLRRDAAGNFGQPLSMKESGYIVDGFVILKDGLLMLVHKNDGNERFYLASYLLDHILREEIQHMETLLELPTGETLLLVAAGPEGALAVLVRGGDEEEKDKIQMYTLELRTIPDPETGQFEATYVTPALDSGIPGVHWHRFAVEADIPDQTQLQVSWQTADEKNLFDDDKWKSLLVNPEEGLIESEEGRYIWLCLKLLGGDLTAPTISSVRVEFPRRSSLAHLPAMYQEEHDSSRFLERFLALLDRFLDEADDIYEEIPVFMDPWGTPPEYLEWLEAWLALEHDPFWSREIRRRLLGCAPQLFRMRGTRQGIRDLLAVHTEWKPPIVIESLQLDENVEEHPWPSAYMTVKAQAGEDELHLDNCSGLEPGMVVRLGKSGHREYACVEHVERGKVRLYAGLQYEHVVDTEVKGLPPGAWLFARSPHEFHLLYPPLGILPYDILVWVPAGWEGDWEEAGQGMTADTGGTPPGRDGTVPWTRVFFITDSGEDGTRMVKKVAFLPPIYCHAVLFKLSQDLSGILEKAEKIDDIAPPRPFEGNSFTSYRLVHGDAILEGLMQGDWGVAAPPGRWRTTGVWLSNEEVQALQRVVDGEKPAHTLGWVNRLEPAIRLDFPSFLELNTIMSRPALILDIRNMIGIDTGPG